MLLQRRLHDPALHAFASPVNQAHFTQSSFMRRADVFVDDGGDVAGGEGVEIELRFDRDLMGV
jgi:hypothetical protein